MADTASTGTGAYAAANWIGLTANSVSPADGDTTLTGEIASGTLARKQGVYGHTLGVASYTVTAVFTSDQAVTPAKYGVFNASTGGTMPFSNLITPASALISGDQETILHTTNI
jgi:hypothetical protein